MDFPKKTAEYSHLRELSTDWGIVYGPSKSRRYGNALGINLLGSGPKACSFNCVYCELGKTTLRMKDLKDEQIFPTIENLTQQLAVEFKRISESSSAIDAITVVGNGEATIHPDFLGCMNAIVSARDKFFPGKKIVVFSNGGQLDSREIVQGLNLADERLIKLDAGSDVLMKQINRPLVRMSVEHLMPGTRKLRDVTLQCMFVQGFLDNTSNKDVEEWIEIVGMIRPKGVQIYSLDRIPTEPGLIKVEEGTLDRIAAQLERRTKIRAVVVP